MLGRRLMDLQLVWLRRWWGLRAYTSRIDMQDCRLAFDSSRNGVPTAIAGFQPTFASHIYIFWTCTKCKSVRLRGTASRHRKKSIGSKKWLPYPSNSFFRVWVPDDIWAIWVCWKSKRNQEPTGSSSPSPVKSSFEIYTVSCSTIRHMLESVSAQFPGFRDTVANGLMAQALLVSGT